MEEEFIYHPEEGDSYYRVRAKVDLDNIRYNLQQMRSLLKADTRLMVVTKADAYGHGAVPVAKAIEHEIDAYGVAIIQEAVELRQSGITKPILVLGYTPKELYPLVIDHDVTQTIFQYDSALALSQLAQTRGKTVKVHIKLDTGMNRIGYPIDRKTVEEIKQIHDLPGITIEGIFSHFATADMEDKSFAKEQLKRFQIFMGWLEQEDIVIPIRHMSNSAGILELPDAQYNMVRCGIASYGIYPSDEVNRDNVYLRPAMELKAHIVYVKDIELGEGIGYGATYVAERRMKVATIPVGYGDGYSRNLSNNGRVIIRGEYAPIVGRICMDQFMADVTEIEGVSQGDVVTLLGEDGPCHISVEELAEGSHSFPYEVLCIVGKRIPRVYTHKQ